MNRGKTILIILFIAFLSSCTSFVKYTSDDSKRMLDSALTTENVKSSDIAYNITGDDELELSDIVFSGSASYYHNKFHGRSTSSGEPYDKDDFTAAHRTLPFGTKLLVRNIKNNKTVIVRVNDRGPFVRGRVLDISRAAAEEIGMISSGVAQIEVTVLK